MYVYYCTTDEDSLIAIEKFGFVFPIKIDWRIKEIIGESKK